MPDHPVVDRPPDVGDHPLAEPGHQVEPRRGPEREQRGDPERGGEVGVDEPSDSAKKLSTTRRTAIGRLSDSTAVTVSAASAAQSMPR